MEGMCDGDFVRGECVGRSFCGCFDLCVVGGKDLSDEGIVGGVGNIVGARKEPLK